MSEATVTNPPATPAQPETVSKQDFVRVQQQAEEAGRNLEVLRQQLADPEYLEYRQAKANSRANPAAPATPVNLQNMTLEQLQQLIVQGAAGAVQQVVKPIAERLEQAEAELELDRVQRKYEDFDEFRDNVSQILKTSTNELTIEQAYLMAKATKPAADPAAPAATAPAAPAAPRGNERPSASVPLDGDSAKTFKTPEAAGQAAWQEVAARRGLSGDTI